MREVEKSSEDQLAALVLWLSRTQHTMGSRDSPGPTLAQAGVWYYFLGSRNQARDEERKERRKGEQEGRRKGEKEEGGREERRGPVRHSEAILLRFECEMAPTGSALSSLAQLVALF